MCAPEAKPAFSAIQPACRPITSTNITRWCDSAVLCNRSMASVATDAIDRLHSTAESHQRVMLVEVMGRHAGWIALNAGLASGAHMTLIPEQPFDVEEGCRRVKRRLQRVR